MQQLMPHIVRNKSQHMMITRTMVLWIHVAERISSRLLSSYRLIKRAKGVITIGNEALIPRTLSERRRQQ
jgi:hypothetical protein